MGWITRKSTGTCRTYKCSQTELVSPDFEDFGMKRLLFTSAIAAAALTLIGARHRATTPPTPAITIDIHRSLVLTHPNDLQGFGLERVLQTLIDRSGATDTSPTSLYRQWFDTQNAKPGLVV